MLQLIKNVLSWRTTASDGSIEMGKSKQEWLRNKRLQDQMAMNKEAKKKTPVCATVMPFVKPEGGDFYQELCAAEESINALNAENDKLKKELYEANSKLAATGHGRQQQDRGIGFRTEYVIPTGHWANQTTDTAFDVNGNGWPTFTRR